MDALGASTWSKLILWKFMLDELFVSCCTYALCTAPRHTNRVDQLLAEHAMQETGCIMRGSWNEIWLGYRCGDYARLVLRRLGDFPATRHDGRRLGFLAVWQGSVITTSGRGGRNTKRQAIHQCDANGVCSC